jgi:aryl-alcohol dehydrogenase-like predicted oxidoreductase
MNRTGTRITTAIRWQLFPPAWQLPMSAPTPDQLLSSLGAMSVELEAVALNRLDEIWPGPEEAPQAHAW